MHNIHTALPALAKRFPVVGSDFRISHEILLAVGRGFVELPTQVLTAAYAVIGIALTSTAREKALAGDPTRRLMLLNISATLEAENHRAQPDDVQTAVGIWSTFVGHGAAMYRAFATDPALRQRAAAYAAFVSQAGLDLAVLVQESEKRATATERSTILEVRALIAEHPGLRRRANATGKAAAQTQLFTGKDEP